MTDLTTQGILTEREAAQYLRVTPAQIKRQRELGEITYKKIGRAVVYRIQWLNDFLDKEEICAANEENQGFTSIKTDEAPSGTSSFTVDNAKELSTCLRGVELARKTTRLSYASQHSS